ncbi:MAG: DUF4288 domain-containing protein [Flavobacterium sp.]|jgi:hypothetical protein|nr:DUF4288 domain-containing protein [Flavobacterium sp.]
MKPKERVSFIQEIFQNNLNKVEKVIDKDLFEIIGTKKKPTGIRIRNNTKIINQIKKLKFIDLTFLKRESNTKTKIKSFFCFKVFYQIQIEGKRKGNQTIEERFILIQSNDVKKAKMKVIKNCKEDEKPYLNTFGQFVKWKLVQIEEPYITYLPIKSNFKNPVEVFSMLKVRRLRKEYIWNE